MKIKSIALTLALTATASTALAASEFSPSSLTYMVNSGTPPAQGSTRIIANESASLYACKSKANAVVSSMTPTYPYYVILDSSSMYSVKLWTNDAALVITCNGSTMKINSATYL